MADIVDRATRARMMSGIRGRNTQPERTVRRFLHRAGLRFRLHAKDLPGRPDVVLPRHRAAVFVHGCFWHQHPDCRKAVMPKSNRDFWQAKLSGNAQRDNRHKEALLSEEWRVFVVWECDIGPERLARLVAEIRGSDR
jgi:DNA mismatch endonuclease, patch repair protein